MTKKRKERFCTNFEYKERETDATHLHTHKVCLSIECNKPNLFTRLCIECNKSNWFTCLCIECNKPNLFCMSLHPMQQAQIVYMSMRPMAMAAVVKDRGRHHSALRCLLFQHEPVTKVHAIYSTVMGMSTTTGSIRISSG